VFSPLLGMRKLPETAQPEVAPSGAGLTEQ
jgi:hypothetical protein